MGKVQRCWPSGEKGTAATLGAVLEAPGPVAGLDDLAVMGEAIEQGGGHLCVAEQGGPFSADEVGGDEDRGALVEAADQVEEELAAGLWEGQIAPLSPARQWFAHKPREGRMTKSMQGRTG